ncbi:hypothetical protein FIM08_03525 [SAR202 cluster bacterium AC-647-N09_OGT_505m]|nr:hypothetical protein [SAR202 cluster bacterium AC-647-N09_OGT_505m]
MRNARIKYGNSDVTVIALYSLGGALRHIHLEDVAIKSAELAPKAFSWRKYPDQVNLETVRLSLKNELGLRSRRVIGSIRDGWMLTPNGLSWCLATLEPHLAESGANQFRNELSRYKRSEAFAKVTTDMESQVSEQDVNALLRIDEYFSPRNVRERIIALSNAAVVHTELMPLVQMLRVRGQVGLETEL